MPRKSSVLKTFNNGYRWEMDDMGNHRLVSNSDTGRWTPYESPAISSDYRFIIFSEYWEGFTDFGVLFSLSPIPEVNNV